MNSSRSSLRTSDRGGACALTAPAGSLGVTTAACCPAVGSTAWGWALGTLAVAPEVEVEMTADDEPHADSATPTLAPTPSTSTTNSRRLNNPLPSTSDNRFNGNTALRIVGRAALGFPPWRTESST